ncbi:hypothetical protein [Saccharomonospora xinjiangensis]|uniref:Abi-like protein n=2 Tax=Saccharomonospora TaxID=1851 RepID=I0V228_9PSEU|nr:Abi-like protein [Saccharomonospora xinjiangensis XJ-54]
MDEMPDWVHDFVSPPRFKPYLKAASGDVATAVRLYWWNIEVSSAFYPSLHFLEVALRNAMHRQLAGTFARDDWWETASLLKVSLSKVYAARAKLTERGRPPKPLTADDVMAQLSLGFWTSLTSKRHDQILWVPCLHRAFPHYRGARERLHRELDTVRLFRNRIMHHEPIFHRDLGADRRTILRLLGYLSPRLLEQLTPYDRVEAVLEQRPVFRPDPGEGDR